MTDTATEASSSPLESPEDQADSHRGPEPDDASETFPRTYVEKLREEAKQARLKAQRADYLATEVRRLATREATRGVLADPSVLAWSDEFEGENGLPDHDALRTAAEALAEAKPWLARPRGDVGQGRHSTGHGAPSLSALLRG